MIENLVKCEELRNKKKKLKIYRRWVDIMMEELFKKGDSEREKNIEIRNMCERKSEKIEK